MPLTASSIQLGPFHGGARYDIPPEEVGAHELSLMENTRIGAGGDVKNRPGIAAYGGESALGGGATDTMIAQFNSNATTEHIVRVNGSAIYKYDSGWSAITGSVTVTAGDDNTWEWVDANGTLVATNGVDTNAWKWAGSGNATDLDDDSRFSKGKHIAWFDNRLWIGNVNNATNQVWYSDTADIETWGATSFFNFGGIVTGLAPTQNALVVHTTDGIYTLHPTGDADNPYRPQKRTIKYALDGRGIATLPGDLQLMILEDGVYEWSGGAELRKVSYALDEGYWPTINEDRLHKAVARRVPGSDFVAFLLPYGASQTNNNHLMFYNYRKRTTINGQNVGIWYGPDKNFERNTMGVIDGKLHLGDFDAQLWDHESETISDDGAPIINIAETGQPSPIAPDVKVRWNSARFYYEAQGDYALSTQQTGAEIVAGAHDLDLAGTTLVLPDPIPAFISDQDDFFQDLPMTGYSPQTGIKMTMNAAGQPWGIRRILLRFKPLGRFFKPKPTD